ncbi:MAG: 50S ribosomal protein L15 [Chloroflexi bacterium]|nr:50S ribosomal protein L15 [Chloroflexota bacterium]
MYQHTIKSPNGARRPRKRVGRGDGSGSGSYSGRGVKGQKSRSGGGVKHGFQGGQLSLLKRLPSMRGFTNIFRQEYSIVNLDQLSVFPADTEVTPDMMVAAGIIRNLKEPVKILGRGELDRALTISAQRFTKSAREKIESAGGRAEEIV